MRLYATLKFITEFSAVAAEGGRRAWSAHWKSYRHWQTYAALVVLGAGVFFSYKLGARLGHETLIGLIGTGVFSCIAFLIWEKIEGRYRREELEHFCGDLERRYLREDLERNPLPGTDKHGSQ